MSNYDLLPKVVDPYILRASLDLSVKVSSAYTQGMTYATKVVKHLEEQNGGDRKPTLATLLDENASALSKSLSRASNKTRLRPKILRVAKTRTLSTGLIMFVVNNEKIETYRSLITQIIGKDPIKREDLNLRQAKLCLHIMDITKIALEHQAHLYELNNFLSSNPTSLNVDKLPKKLLAANSNIMSNVTQRVFSIARLEDPKGYFAKMGGTRITKANADFLLGKNTDGFSVVLALKIIVGVVIVHTLVSMARNAFVMVANSITSVVTGATKSLELLAVELEEKIKGEPTNAKLKKELEVIRAEIRRNKSAIKYSEGG